MEYKGYAWKFGDDIDTDLIIPARYLNTSDPDELAKHCMEDADPEFSKKISKGDIICAGKNFGCGSSREHAPIAIQAAGISCVIAVSFARIFYRNAFNTGLPILECPDAYTLKTGMKLHVDMDAGKITDTETGRVFQATAIPEFMQELIKSGGLMNHIRKRIQQG